MQLLGQHSPDEVTKVYPLLQLEQVPSDTAPVAHLFAQQKPSGPKVNPGLQVTHVPTLAVKQLIGTQKGLTYV